MSTMAPAAADTTLRTYFYKVRNRHGQIKTGTMQHSSRNAVVVYLNTNPEHVSVLKVTDLQEKGIGPKSMPKARSLVLFARQMENCLTMGMDNLAAIDEIREGDDLEDKVLLYGLGQVSRDMAQGMQMSDAMAKLPYIFPPVMTETIRAGEQGANLGEAITHVAEDLERQDDQKARLRKAMIYPVTILSFAFVIFTFLMVVIVTRFTELYAELGASPEELPAITRMVSGMSDIIIFGAPAFVLVVIAGVWIFRRNRENPRMHEILDPLKLEVPIFGPMQRKTALARFCRTYPSLTERGIERVDALRICADSIGNIAYKKSLEKAMKAINSGESIATPLRADKLFPKSLVKNLALGEKTGRTAKALATTGRMYERDVEEMADRMQQQINPIFTVVLTVMVGFVALAIFMPYFSMGDIMSPY